MISLIAAIQKGDRGIGLGNELLYRLSDDLKRFKALTTGHVVIMGRKTWESLPEKVRPLPGRENIVITRNRSYQAPGAHVVHDAQEALALAARQFPDKECFVIGGAEIYAHTLHRADRLLLTLIDGSLPADAFFPDHSAFTRIISQQPGTDPTTGIAFEYLVLER